MTQQTIEARAIAHHRTEAARYAAEGTIQADALRRLMLARIAALTLGAGMLIAGGRVEAHKGCDSHKTPVQSHGCTHEQPKGGK